MQVGKEGEHADPTSCFLSALLRAPSFRSSPPLALPARVQSTVLKPGGASAPLTRGPVWDHGSCKPSPQGSPTGRREAAGSGLRFSFDTIRKRVLRSQLSLSPRRLLRVADSRPRSSSRLQFGEGAGPRKLFCFLIYLGIVGTQYFTSCNSSQGTIQ